MTRRYTPLAMPDATAGIVVRSPEREEAGYWVGCPTLLHEDGRFWMTYRQRRPRGAESERGWRCAVAVSDDGVTFTDVWSVNKEELNTSSMERFCLTKTDNGRYRLYLSYVDPIDSRWRIDAVTADAPGNLDIAKLEPVLTAESTGTEGVKDPYVIQVGPVTHLFASYAAARHGLAADAHASADIYNVGVTTHPTGLATSLDGSSFTWQGEALSVGEGWDRYQARLSCVVPTEAGWLGFYDGSAGHDENYEERCGICVSADLRTWHKVSDTGPWLVSPWGSGSVRYLDALRLDHQWWLYYELTRADGAHELRMLRTPVS